MYDRRPRPEARTATVPVARDPLYGGGRGGGAVRRARPAFKDRAPRPTNERRKPNYTPLSSELRPDISASNRPAEGALGPYLRAIRGSPHAGDRGHARRGRREPSPGSPCARRPITATANILVTPLAQDDQTFLGLQVVREAGDPTRTVQTAATLIKSLQAAQRTAAQMGGDWTSKKVLDAITVTPGGREQHPCHQRQGRRRQGGREAGQHLRASPRSTRAAPASPRRPRPRWSASRRVRASSAPTPRRRPPSRSASTRSRRCGSTAIPPSSSPSGHRYPSPRADPRARDRCSSPGWPASPSVRAAPCCSSSPSAGSATRTRPCRALPASRPGADPASQVEPAARPPGIGLAHAAGGPRGVPNAHDPARAAPRGPRPRGDGHERLHGRRQDHLGGQPRRGGGRQRRPGDPSGLRPPQAGRGPDTRRAAGHRAHRPPAAGHAASRPALPAPGLPALSVLTTTRRRGRRGPGGGAQPPASGADRRRPRALQLRGDRHRADRRDQRRAAPGGRRGQHHRRHQARATPTAPTSR